MIGPIPVMHERDAAQVLSDLHVTSRAWPGTGSKGRARATAPRRLCPIAGKYTVEEELLEHLPAAHVRRPRVDYESHAAALDRNELGALLVAAGLGLAAQPAPISLLAPHG